MIEKLRIERFKSIQTLEIPCKKVNMFIGAPDTGKTNMLEALYFLSRMGWRLPIDFSLRLRDDIGLEALYYRQFIDQSFLISLDMAHPYIHGNYKNISIQVKFVASSLHLKLLVNTETGQTSLGENAAFNQAFSFPNYFNWIRFYSYVSSGNWTYDSGGQFGTEVVTPPEGRNLMYIARHNEKVYQFLIDILKGLNWKLRFDQSHRTFRFSEVKENEIFDYNIDLLSDSLKRLFFYSAIILTSQNVTLVFDEPDVFAFPPYPKILGEMIADDESNQFFLTTHNPYFLSAVVEKTPIDNLALFVCYRNKDGSTGAKLLSKQEVEKVIEQGQNVFFNLDEFLTEDT